MDALYSYSVLDKAHQLEFRVRPLGDEYMLAVRTSADEVGVLFRLCAVLFVHGCSIREATIGTDAGGVRDDFRIRSQEPITEVGTQAMVADLRDLLFGGQSVLGYLKEQAEVRVREPRGGQVTVQAGVDYHEIRLATRDQVGLLLSLTQAFYLMDISIQKATVTTRDDGQVTNTFHIDAGDERFGNAEFRRRLSDELTSLL